MPISIPTASTGHLVGFDSEQAAESLLFMIEEEKMAREIYGAFYTQPISVFFRI